MLKYKRLNGHYLWEMRVRERKEQIGDTRASQSLDIFLFLRWTYGFVLLLLLLIAYVY